jgi:hypothetical protein
VPETHEVAAAQTVTASVAVTAPVTVRAAVDQLAPAGEAAPTVNAAPVRRVSDSPLFQTEELAHLALEGDFDTLDKEARDVGPGEALKATSVPGKLKDLNKPGSPEIDVLIHIRGNTSVTTEDFPKIEIEIVNPAACHGTLFAHAHDFKIGTHGSDTAKTDQYGRYMDQKATYREDCGYRVLRQVPVTTLLSRPALIEYRQTDPKGGEPKVFVRQAMLLENTHQALKRLNAELITDEEAKALLANDDRPIPVATLIKTVVAEMLMGNTDFELPSTDKPQGWNLTWIRYKTDNTMDLILHDLDIAWIVNSHLFQDYAWNDATFAYRLPKSRIEKIHCALDEFAAHYPGVIEEFLQAKNDLLKIVQDYSFVNVVKDGDKTTTVDDTIGKNNILSQLQAFFAGAALTVPKPVAQPPQAPPPQENPSPQA